MHHQALEGSVGIGTQVTPPVTTTERFDLGAVFGESGAITLEQLRSQMRLEAGTVLRIDQHNIVAESRIAIFRTDNVRREHVVTETADDLERRLESGCVKKVRGDNN